MTKTQLQVALAEATQTNKRTAGVFLDTLGTLAYKAIKKNGEFVLPGFGKLVKQKRKARVGFNPKNTAEDQDSSQDRCQISSRQGGQGCDPGSQKVILQDLRSSWPTGGLLNGTAVSRTVTIRSKRALMAGFGAAKSRPEASAFMNSCNS
jgi:DNA-binding protein HU-beta